jgi:multidrug resistance efflux pump
VLSDDTVSFLRVAESPVASALSLVQRAQKGRLQQALAESWKLLQGQRGHVVLAVVAAVALTICIPIHYQARCDCTVEPVTRRYVAAPFDGPLEKSLVEPGDVVEEGQLLARMDGREVKWELAGTRADLHRAAKQRAGHVASHASGQAAIARHEVDRLQMRTELLEHRDQNLEIRSPIGGVVVSGDLEDAEGIPLTIGETLFEIAPLDQMVVEVAIREDDFSYVRSGMLVTIRLDAYPLRKFDAVIERVHPRAELLDDANVFVGEVRLACPDNMLRPGMRGKARIKADRYPLGWNLFRRPMTAVIAWLGW